MRERLGLQLLLLLLIGIVKAQDCTEGAVRLADGPSERFGRVELCYQGTWGTVCDDGWDDLDAQVVCRQLNFSATGARGFGFRASIGAGTGPIHLDSAACTGAEETLLSCNATIQDHDCNHFEDAGVACEEPGFTCDNGELRLLDGNTMYEGRVEVCLNNKFTSICSLLWSNEEAAVVCGQLGFTEGGSAYATSGGSFGQGVGSISLSSLTCTGQESNLTECSTQASIFDFFCSHSDDVGVLCPRPNASCADGDIRLSGGRVSSEGFLELCLNGHWGTICHDSWTEEDAQVACRELGFLGRGAKEVLFSDLGRGEDLILLSQFRCDGNESRLFSCPSDGPADHFCSHFETAGLICPDPNNTCVDGALRLVDGNTPNEGRLEICFENHWGTVCDDDIGRVEANLVCRLLGFEVLDTASAIGLHGAFFGEGVGLIFLDDLDCDGNESSLFDCSHSGIGISNCFHNEDVSILCPKLNDTCVNGEIRLVNGTGNHSGRVEICFNGLFGTVCDDEWDDQDAAVVCRQLGFPGEGAVGLSGSYFGEGTGPIFLDNSDCSPANHSDLISCFDAEAAVGEHNCDHSEDASVICPLASRTCGDSLNGDIRLVGGTTEFEGRVEVCLDGEWGTVCDNFWSESDAAVVCRQLTFGPTDARAVIGARFGQGNGSIHFTSVFCNGDEDRLTNCIHFPVRDRECTHVQDAGVICSTMSCENGEIRLVDGNVAGEGRVEVCFDDVFGTICDDGWNSQDAQVVCRQLGFNNGNNAVALPQAFFGQGSGAIHVELVRCTGNESTLLDCPFRRDPFFCFHFEDAGVLCQSENASLVCENGDLRLTGGERGNEGNIEICFNGNWGSVCQDRWGSPDAQAACSILGFTDADPKYTLPTTSAFFGQGTGPIFLDNLDCAGNESSLLDCPSTIPGVGDHDCSHFLDAGVICPVSNFSLECVNGDVRLVDGSAPHEGRVEICLNGVWGTVCDDRWGTNEAAVVCDKLTFGREGAVAQRGGTFAAGSGPVYLSGLGCDGTEAELFDCPFRGPGVGTCSSHTRDAGVTCQAPPCYDGDIRLVGGTGPFEGTVQLCSDREWSGTVCNFNWDNRDAAVVCRQLGFPAQDAIALGEFFGDIPFGSGGRIVRDEVDCTGNETRLSDCPSVSPFFCFEQAGVLCSPGGPVNCSNGEVRIVDGGNQYEGRVEVCLHGRWGTVCDDSWDSRDAAVVCRQLGYSSDTNSSIMGVAIASRRATFGEGEGLILMDEVNCTGSESTLLQCSASDIGDHNCRPIEDASVHCPFPGSACVNGDLRLVNGSKSDRGRVELCYGGEWRSICRDEDWGLEEAQTVCRQLNFSNPEFAHPATAGGGSGEILSLFLECTGQEDRLTDCPVPSFVFDSDRCLSHDNDAGVICQPEDANTTCADGDVRLVDGATPNEGRVEICYDNQFGTVCDDNFNTPEARVVCRQLGFTADLDNSVTVVGGFFGIGFLPIHLDELECSGNETNLLECPHNGISVNNCGHSEDAGVICIVNNGSCTHGDVRLVSGQSELQGRLEVCLGGNWGTVCNDGWSAEDAQVVCRQLGHQITGALAVSALVFEIGTGLILLDNLGCSGDEERLVDCPANDPGVHNCFHEEDAAVICQPPQCENGGVRLMNGTTSWEGRVELCVNGVWATVCDANWGKPEAQVVCRQLSYSNYEDSVSVDGGNFPPGTGRVLSGFSCTGAESSLDECSTGPPITCLHSQDAGVLCIPDDQSMADCITGDVRLSNGTEVEGRLEVCVGGRWGTVCSDGFDDDDASVVCRQLGFQAEGAQFSADGRYGTAAGFIFLSELDCDENDTRLIDCDHLGTGVASCSHSEDVGVMCVAGPTTPAPCATGELRLVGGANSSEGTVEVCVSGVWGTVCDTNWGEEAAGIVCDQLGFGKQDALGVRGAFFGAGTGPIHFRNLECTGTETLLTDCPDRPIFFPFFFCSHSDDAGVICSTNATRDCRNGDVRLADGGNQFEGRVEVCLHGRWGTVCDDSFDSREAAVVCRQLGYTENGLPWNLGGAEFGPGEGLILLDETECEGTEDTLLSCRADGLGEHNCRHAEDASVFCPYPGSPCRSGDVRLVDGDKASEGRVEVCVGGRWGTGCADPSWSDEDAAVICRQLGYPDVESQAIALTGGTFGEGTGTIFLGSLRCLGNESSVLECESRIGVSFGCEHSDDMAAECQRPSNVCDDFNVRLVNGETPNEGRVEVCYDDHWGTVCDDQWGAEEARVVCRQLGYGTGEGSVAIVRGHFGGGRGRIHLDDISCNGSESNLNDCEHLGVREHDCSHSEDAGVICLNDEPSCVVGDVRLVGGSTEFEGRVEVCLAGRWGTVCDDSWGTQEATVVCRQLGYNPEGAEARGRAFFGEGTDPVFFDQTGCVGTEERLVDCPSDGEGVHNCQHSEDAGVVCLPPPCKDGSFRLLGGEGEFNGVPQVCINELWGSVCADTFSTQAAGLVCDSLGLEKSGGLQIPGKLFKSVTATSDIMFDVILNCTSGNDCTLIVNETTSCPSSAPAGMLCPVALEQGMERVCTSGALRLGGGGVADGRVEVCLNNQWGTVCDDSWDDRAAAVVCRQLGLPFEGAFAEAEGRFGPGTGPILLDDVKCTGTEENIFQCDQIPLSFSHNCQHTEDAGVACRARATTSDSIPSTTATVPEPGVSGASTGTLVGIIIPLVLIIAILIVIIIVVVIIFLLFKARKSGKLMFRSFDDERPIVGSESFSGDPVVKEDIAMTEKTDAV